MEVGTDTFVRAKLKNDTWYKRGDYHYGTPKRKKGNKWEVEFISNSSFVREYFGNFYEEIDENKLQVLWKGKPSD